LFFQTKSISFLEAIDVFLFLLTPQALAAFHPQLTRKNPFLPEKKSPSFDLFFQKFSSQGNEINPYNAKSDHGKGKFIFLFHKQVGP
jgi:hypothetical protein